MKKRKEIAFGSDAWAKRFFRKEIKDGIIPELSENKISKTKSKKDTEEHQIQSKDMFELIISGKNKGNLLK